MNKTELRKTKTRIQYNAKEGLNHIAPTISPAPPSNTEIESLSGALRYYASHGIESVVLQPKYMGSYVDIYLHKDIQNTYFVSRNGYRINYVPQDALIEALVEVHRKIDWDRYKMILLQGELLPWSYLGKGLIDRVFNKYSNALISQYQNIYTDGNIVSKIASIKNTAAYNDFIKDYNVLLKDELKEKYPPHVITQYTAIYNNAIPTRSAYFTGMSKFKAQLNKYGSDEKVEIKIFGVLKYITHEDTEVIGTSNLAASLLKLNEDPYVIVKTEDYSSSLSSNTSYKNFKDFIENMEGMVVKPIKMYAGRNIAPALKIRNIDYLHLIYGWDFNHNFNTYLKKRRVNRKIKLSCDDWHIAQRLVRIKYKEVGTHEDYESLLMSRYTNEYLENKLDASL